MKKAIRILLPIFLILLILGSLVWYLLVYDREFTQEMLLRQARYQEDRGNHSVAAWLYNQAYIQSDQDPDVAIELADQFKAIGNYTKAEYTLSNAIANGGSYELYIALCKTYVEQDKLLDAVTMLENVADPEIKNRLDSLRPEMPAADHEPGFYSQYISVGFDTGDAVLYVNTHSTYPSVNDPRYEEPITLPVGETTLYAVAIADNGLVSRLGIYGYTISGVVEKVEFTDKVLESTLHTILEIPESKQLLTSDLWQITELETPEDVSVFDDLQYLPYLRKLVIHNSAADLTSISALTELEELDLTGCTKSDEVLGILAELPNLQKLTLAECELSSIADLEGAAQLTYLDLRHNTIRNINALSAMPELQELYLQHNALKELSAIRSLGALTKLDISYNSVASLADLSEIDTLSYLMASNNQIVSLSGLQKLTDLVDLDVSFNKLEDVSPISGLVNLESLDISNNTLTDILCLSKLNKMLVFNFSHNEVTQLPAWSEDSALVSIDGSYNQLENLDELQNFGQLNLVYMDYNLLTSVDVLESCPLLVQVNVYGNEIEDVSCLTHHSIIVNYTPLNAKPEETEG